MRIGCTQVPVFGKIDIYYNIMLHLVEGGAFFRQILKNSFVCFD